MTQLSHDYSLFLRAEADQAVAEEAGQDDGEMALLTQAEMDDYKAEASSFDESENLVELVFVDGSEVWVKTPDDEWMLKDF